MAQACGAQALRAFLAGFHALIPPGKLPRFTATELEAVLCGQPSISEEARPRAPAPPPPLPVPPRAPRGARCPGGALGRTFEPFAPGAGCGGAAAGEPLLAGRRRAPARAGALVLDAHAAAQRRPPLPGPAVCDGQRAPPAHWLPGPRAPLHGPGRSAAPPRSAPAPCCWPCCAVVPPCCDASVRTESLA
jgi:hypothetical protein